MKKIVWTALLAMVLTACGSPRPLLGTADNPQCDLRKNGLFVSDDYDSTFKGKLEVVGLNPDTLLPIDPKVNFEWIDTKGFSQARKKVVTVLELSAGGEYGAYGSAFLEGWGTGTQSVGNSPMRTDVQVVAGVSTGALMATHAFLGNRDAELRKFYETLKSEDIYKSNGIIKLIRANSLYDASGKYKVISENITSTMIDEVAKAPEGRRLYIGLVDMDSGAFKRVDMVKLAGAYKGNTKLRDTCYRKVIDGSSAIQIAFNPVFIDNHMYADGGARRFLFMVSPNQVLTKEEMSKLNSIQFRTVSLVHGDLSIESLETENGIVPIAKQGMEVTLDQGLKDSLRLNEVLSKHPELLLDKETADKQPRMETFYSAATDAACVCRVETNAVCGRDANSKSDAGLFCSEYMKCLARIGFEDGKAIAKTGAWKPFTQLQLGSGGQACTEAKKMVPVEKLNLVLKNPMVK